MVVGRWKEWVEESRRDISILQRKESMSKAEDFTGLWTYFSVVSA